LENRNSRDENFSDFKAVSWFYLSQLALEFHGQRRCVTCCEVRLNATALPFYDLD